MKTLLLLSLLLSTTPTIKDLSSADGTFMANVDGKSYSGKNNHATMNLNYAHLGINVFTIESFKSNDALAGRTDAHFIFSINFTGNIPQKGAYALQDVNLKKPFTTNTGVYDKGWNSTSSGSPTESSYKFAPAKGGSGTLIITSINGNAVSGTFSGIAVNSKKEKILITNGTFTNLIVH